MASQSIHAIIHTASVTSAGIGGGLAQLPGSDCVPLMAVQGAMVVAIAAHHGVSLDKASAQSLVGTFAATIAGRGVSQFLVGWIPGVGNAINAATAAGITEAIGWAADTYYSDPNNR